METNRRNLLKYSLGAGGLLALSPWSAVSASTPNFTDIHLAIADLAKSFNHNSTLTILLPTGSESNVYPVTQLFTQKTGVNIKLMPVPLDDINTEMLLAHGLGDNTYDIALPATFGIPDLAESGVITDLSELQQQYQPEGFQDNALYTLGNHYRGRFYGYQVDGDAYMMFYNTGLVSEDDKKQFADRFGYAFRTPLTWDELDQQMAFFHRPEQDQFGGALFRNSNYVLWEFWMRFHAEGILPLADDLTPQMSTNAGVRALEALIKASEHQCPHTSVNGLFENWQDYSVGNIYANIGWGGSQKYFNLHAPELQGKLSYSAAPSMRKGDELIPLPYFNWGWNYTVASNSTQKELAYLFTLFAVSPVPSTISVRAKDGFFDPFRTEHYDDKEIQNTYSNAFLTEHRQALTNSIPDFYIQGQSQYFNELRRYIMLALEGHISVERALENVDNRWLLLHKKFGQDSLMDQWQHLREQYPQDFLKHLTS